MQTRSLNWIKISSVCTAIVLLPILTGCGLSQAKHSSRWNTDLAYVHDITPITFHYDHGVLAGSYPEGEQTVDLEFDDVCAKLGHVCLCGAGGFRVAGKAAAALGNDNTPLKRDEFILISSRDHTVSDVIAFVLGCVRRKDVDRCSYFIDDSITALRREYHYYIAYEPTETAVHVVYRKHLLIGHEKMDELWKIETSFDRDPQSVSADDVNRYRKAMRKMVEDVLLGKVPNLITVEPVPYCDFTRLLDIAKNSPAG